jgi:hypothetical protein
VKTSTQAPFGCITYLDAISAKDMTMLWTLREHINMALIRLAEKEGTFIPQIDD